MPPAAAQPKPQPPPVPKSRTSPDKNRPSTPSAASEEKWYKVFVPEFDRVSPDPLEEHIKRFHVGIFIEKDPESGIGDFFHVTGDLMMRNGMSYETKTNWDARNSRQFVKMTQLGWIHETDSSFSTIDSILRKVDRPARQQGINFELKDETWNRVVWIEEDGRPSPNNIPTRQIRKCNEWVWDAEEALDKAGILKWRREVDQSDKSTRRPLGLILKAEN
ncbi:hypothetical protein N7466_010113 [Penicillium verhagenii]|uniref:uncharacterized protein n=1 Tax=Penicillium verhagenii TaxID=1562060 RepID=UPI002544F0E8|nr:uncharacterized protein N7466_010113 [Penicillium verhagenii]KAJ5919170.1 hypothetical protein N7466_010113 [Penicillium verhagenii]